MGDDDRKRRRRRKKEYEFEIDLGEGLKGLAEGIAEAFEGTAEVLREVEMLRETGDDTRDRDVEWRQDGTYRGKARRERTIRVETRNDRQRNRDRDERKEGQARQQAYGHQGDRQESMPPPLAQREVPPETPSEIAARLVKAFFNPGALFVLGGMLIAGEISELWPLVAGGFVFYVALVSAAFTQMGMARDKRMRKLVASGQPLPSTIAPPQPQRRVIGSRTPIPQPTDAAGLYVQRLNVLVGRLKEKGKGSAQGLIDASQLDGYVKVADEYLAKHREVAAYLHSVGGAAAAKHDCETMRKQIEEQRALLSGDDPRFESWAKLLKAKESTATNLAGLDHFLLAVEAKLAEQVAMLESLDSSLMRHSLGSFQQQQSVEDELFSQEVTTLSQGLEENSKAMEQELREVRLV